MEGNAIILSRVVRVGNPEKGQLTQKLNKLGGLARWVTEKEH